MKKVAHATEESGTFVRGVARHLKHPVGGGMFGQTGESDAARFQMNEEQDVVGGETSPGQHFDCEEVGTCQDGHVGGDEILPGGVLAPLGCWLDPRTDEGCFPRSDRKQCGRDWPGLRRCDRIPSRSSLWRTAQ